MYEFDPTASQASQDELFLERLEAFMQKSLSDIRAFAERESRPFEETRRSIAQWHGRYLFEPPLSSGNPGDAGLHRASQVRSVLCNTSRVLESLSETAGVQSFLLAVDPLEGSDQGFLGGTVIGREFWRGLRNGGEAGARTFRAHSIGHMQQNKGVIAAVASNAALRSSSATPPPKALTKTGDARSIKNELYESVRNALRLASGVRNAEMKWTNPERLDVYGVRLMGWPKDIPAQNPSTMKVSQNKALLDALQNGSMKFERLFPLPNDKANETPEADKDDLHDDFSWALDVDATPSLSAASAASSLPVPHDQSNTVTKTRSTPIMPASLSAVEIVQDSWPTLNPPPLEAGSSYDEFDADYAWDNELGDPVIDEAWRDDGSERPKKRLRSEEASSSAAA